ncbi:TonB-dependent receptor [Brenneria goodwinii]|uniref:Ferric vulnibactin receptor VuuA n=1 Tax=Brenneria goodwinii TaxID=1109412 RepID=A0A0G4JYJ4_9GAMM|nr:TonB-dependent receptor [Brenneria goodwinii]MCG8157278.1 TonB-dependent receptor [Brenneria goodwinii]MCG8162232.1 TonB-dependent receptor [Brenneria goodwinii]MCG8166162.1 TonB-dependent receptor [Brenneria goodwinii]MCG8170789.1 TonB-dependent receptor [Brenneria goodwinii]MCG8175859.1 TonB-dependent receptor [Brenneria goodwinii]
MADDTGNKVKNTTEKSEEEIIVTGERFDRREVETGSSVNIITDKELARRPDLYSLTQVFKETPNIIDTGLGNELPTIRGIEGSTSPGSMVFLTGARPRFNISIDGRTSNYNELAYGTKSLWDMKQVEVYRGPQSYAQGRNAIAGAVVIQSNDPTNEYEGAVKLDYGNQDRRQYAAMLSGPLINEELLFRLSMDRQERQSYEHLAKYSPAGDSRKFEATTTRAKLLWLPSAFPDFYSRYTFSHIDSRAPQGEFKPSNESETYRAVFQVRSATNIWDVGYQINDFLKFENKAIYSNYIQDRYALASGGPARVEGHEIQVEPILKFDIEKYRGLLGLFYYTSPQDETVLLINQNSYRDETKTKAVYGEITFDPVEHIEVNMSARYEEEDHSRNGGNLFVVNYENKEKIFLPKLDVAWLFNDDHRIGAKVARGYNPGGAGISFVYPFATYEYDTEYVWSYELYHRWISPDKRLKLNTNFFYNDYKDLQIPYYDAFGSAVIDNADKAITYGAEFNLNWQATDDLNVFAGVGLLKTKIQEYTGNPSYENNKLSRSPGYTLNVGGSYQFPAGFEIGANVNYTDSYYSSVSNSRDSKTSGYSQANAYIAYNFKHGRVTLYTENAFDSHEKTKIITGGYTTYQQPRVVGLSTELRF